MPVYIIAEAGVNHNGSLKLAKKLVEAAAEAGADAVKFQTFKAEHVISGHAKKAEYQVVTTGNEESQLDMVRKLQLSETAHFALIEECQRYHIAFLSAPFDLESLQFLNEKCSVDKIKIPSGELTNAPFLFSAAHTRKPIIMSTGMSTLGDIETALGILAYGYLESTPPKGIEECAEVFASPEGQAVLQEKVTLLHCTTEYPAPVEDVNLTCMETMRRAFGLSVGYSDHTEGITIPVAAAALGATVVEKHFTLDRNMEGPDHRASLEPDELFAMVRAIRVVEKAIGNGRKFVAKSERKNMNIARKSLIANAVIRKGEIFTEKNLTVKRPGDGMSPLLYWSMIGEVASRDYEADERIWERR